MTKTSPIKVACEFMWVFADKVSETSNKYQADICNLSADAIKALTAEGIEVRNLPNRPEKGNFITVKSIHPITVVDGEGNQLLDKVGNGSKGYAVIQPYAWSFKGKKGISAGAAKLVVTHLVSYGGAEDDDSDIL